MPCTPLLSRLVVLLAVTLLAPASGSSAERGKLTGGLRYEIPGWFKQSFLELAEDASEAAESGRHAMLFIHSDECPYCAALLQESLIESAYAAWFRQRFDAIAINTRGAREVAFDADTVVSERELVQLLKVRQTPTVIFLDGDNNSVLRVAGYRTPTEFERILEFVDSRAYRTTDLASFVARADRPRRYTPRQHPAFQPLDDLSRTGKPLLVILEDAWCDACDLLHNTLLADPEVNALLAELRVVRLDAESDAVLVDPEGQRTTPRAWSRALGIHARPGLLLFDGPRELARIEGVLRHFHFTTALRYAAERRFTEYPTLRDFARAHREALLRSGAVIDMGRQ